LVNYGNIIFNWNNYNTMEQEKLESRLIDYIDGLQPDEERLAIEKEIAENSEVKKLYEQLRTVMQAMDSSKVLRPSVNLQLNFEKAVQQEARKAEAKVIQFQPVWYRVAASVALLITATFVGLWVYQNNQHQAELAAVRKEMEETKNMMLKLISNDLSASQRLMGVTVANTIETTDAEITDALFKALNEDTNTNVRLAALEALSRFSSEPAIRTALINALAEQKDPIVQIALIQLLADMKEKSILPTLKNIIDSKQSMKAVKDEAHTAVLKLS